jgi:hypothetical protein
MTSVRQPPVAGAVEFADATTDARSRTAAGPLGRATLATLQAPPILPARPWRWRLHHATAELWLTPTPPAPDRPQPGLGCGPGEQQRPRSSGRPEDADRRRLVVTAGIALHQALVALAGSGHTAEVHRLPDPHCPDLLAELTIARRTPITVATAHAYRAMLLGTAPTTVSVPIPRQRRATPGPAELLPLLREAATASGAGLHPLPTAPHLTQPTTAAGAATDTDTAIGTGTGFGALDPTTTYAVLHVGGDAVGAADPGCRYAVLSAAADTAAGWLAAGEALAAVVIAASALGSVPVSAGALVDSRAIRDALAPLLPGGAAPVVVLRIGGTGGPSTPGRHLPTGDLTNGRVAATAWAATGSRRPGP